MTKTDPRTEMATFRAPRWAWTTIDELLRAGRESADLNLRIDIENAKDVMQMLPDPAYRVRFVVDEDASFEESNGEPRPLNEEEYAKDYYLKDGQPMSYADYRAYYGNPDRHVYVGAILERTCVCCNHWESAASLWRIDFMDDSPEVDAIGKTFAFNRFSEIPGYLRDVAQELMLEAK